MACRMCEVPQHRIIKEYEHWIASVADSQQLLGYLNVSLREHKENLTDLTNDELLEFREVCRELQGALDKLFQPDRYNYQQMGNMTRHVYFHLIPRYQHPRLFEGRQFIDERYGKLPERRWVFEEDEFLTALADAIRAKI